MDEETRDEWLELDTPDYLDWAALVARYDQPRSKEALAYSRRHYEEHGHSLSWGCCKAAEGRVRD